MRIGLRGKFCILFLIFGAAMMAALWIVLSQFTIKLYLEDYKDSIGKIVNVTAETLDLTPEELCRYAESGIADEHYWEVLDQMKTICELSGFAYLYIIYPTGVDTAVWVFDTEEGGEELAAPVVDYNEAESLAVRETYQSGKTNDDLDLTGYHEQFVVSIYYPMKDEAGNTIAVLGADVWLQEIVEVYWQSMKTISARILILLVAGLCIFLLCIQFGVIRSINRLKRGVRQMSIGELDVNVPCRRRDEIGDITVAFNRMSAAISRHVGEMNELNCAYQKFIPPETFDILHKNSVVEIKRGDQAEEMLTVLSMEPCGFREKTKDMSAEQTFAYINGILEKIVPAVLAEGGTIERFDKAGICSFYRNDAEHALKSAIQSCVGNGGGGETFSVGIAWGKVMVGIAGAEERMNIISISQQKKLSDFLMELANKYCATILIDQSAAARIDSLKEDYHCRFLGYIKISSSGSLEGIIDVFDADSPEERRYKQMTKEQFERGVGLFCQGAYREARQIFIDVLRQYRRDAAARKYLYLCSRYMQEENTAGDVWIETL